jgi:hypothetical protein
MKRRDFLNGATATASAIAAGLAVPSTAGDMDIGVGAVVTLQDFGAVGDDVTDDTKSVQDAVDYCGQTGASLRVYRTTNAYRLTAPIQITAPLVFLGDGCSPDNGGTVANHGVRGAGSWFHLAHTGRGFVMRPQGGELTGVIFDGIGTFRDHPDPVAGWSPTAHDFDFYCDGENGDFRWSNVTVLNPYQAFYLNGRCTLDNVRGQPLNTGIFTNLCADTCRLSRIHFWPFWSQNGAVKAYQLANSRAFWFHRTDNPSMIDCFSLWYFAGLCVSQNASGSVAKMRVTNCDFDAGLYGILIDKSVTTGMSMQIANCTSQSEGGVSAGIGIFIQGNGCRVDAANFASAQNIQNAVRLDGTGNSIRMSQCRVTNWNLSGAGFPAVEVASGNTATIVGGLDPSGGQGALLYGGAGQISAELGYGVVTGTTDNSGLLTVSHHGGAVPNMVVLTLRAPDADINLRIDSMSATTFAVRAYSSGQPFVGTLALYWNAKI